MPELPDADQAVGRVVSAVQAWSEGGPPPRIQLVGPSGTGKSTALRRAFSELASQECATAMAVDLPDLDLDGHLHLAMQTSGALRDHGVNGVVERVFARDVPWAERRDGLKEGMGEVGRPVLFVDIPSSWGRSPATADPFSVRGEAIELLRHLLDAGAGLVLAVEHTATVPGLFEDVPARTMKLGPGSPAGAILEDAQRWRSLEQSASSLAEVLGSSGRRATPLEVRLAVALTGLGRPAVEAQRALEAGLGALLRALLDQASGPARSLHRLWAMASMFRAPVAPSLLDELAETIGEDRSDGFAIMRDALLIPMEGSGLELHPALRGSAPARALNEQERAELHQYISEALAKSGVGSSTQASVRNELEVVYHAALGMNEERVLERAVDGWQLCLLARELSWRGDLRAALGLYERVLRVNVPTNAYAMQYAAYHMERLGWSPRLALTYFSRCADLEPSNPWWVRRHVEALIRRGRLRDAMSAWRGGLARLTEDVPEGLARGWLAANYHCGVARLLLSRGALEEAREVLQSVPEAVRARSDELRGLWDDLRLMEEVDELGGAVFPRTVPFDHRWDGPHTRTDVTDRPDFVTWFPGRVEEITEDSVVLLLAQRDADGAVELFHMELGLQEFQEMVQRWIDPGLVGRFVELLVFTGGDGMRQVVALHPASPRGPRSVRVGPLTLLEEEIGPEAARA
jgi:tetratricopeptide (TPR) repeat protein